MSDEGINQNSLEKITYREEEVQDSFQRGLDWFINSLRGKRQNPLLVMYYPNSMGQITDEDMDTLYEQFRRRGFSRDNKKIEELDVLLHTLGGDPDAGYMMAQILRSFSNRVNFLVPFHAASAGTLLTFCGDNILLGAYAYLTPIDISVIHEGIGRVSVMAIEYFMEFARDCRTKMDVALDRAELDTSSAVDSKLLVELVDQVDAITVGSLYRMRRLTEHYAWLLLSDYMFKKKNDAGQSAERISHDTVFSFPAHEFYMDFKICSKIGLSVEEMNEDQSEITKDMVRFLDNSTHAGTICKQIRKNYRIPFISLYAQ